MPCSFLDATTVSNRICDCWSAGIYRSYRVNGVPAASLVLIPVLGALVHGMVVGGIITAISVVGFGATIPVHWGWFFGVFVLTTLALASLGILIGVVSPSQRAGLLLAQAIYIPSVLLSGMMVPQTMIPDTLQPLVALLPASHGIRAFELLAMQSNGIPQAAAVALGTLITSIALNLLLSLILFQWDARQMHIRRCLVGLLALLPFAVSILL